MKHMDQKFRTPDSNFITSPFIFDTINFHQYPKFSPFEKDFEAQFRGLEKEIQKFMEGQMIIDEKRDEIDKQIQEQTSPDTLKLMVPKQQSKHTGNENGINI
jgi:hypothetical protein